MQRKLFVSNLPVKTTDMDLLNIFQRFGPISKVYMVRNRNDGSCKNFGFVVFQKIEDATRLLNTSETLKLRGRRIRLRKAVDRCSTVKADVYTA